MLRKIFNMRDYRRTKLYIITAIVSVALYIPVSRLTDPPFDRWLESRNEARHEARRQAFQEEVTRRRAERKETDNNIVKTPPVSPVEPVDTPTDRTSTGSAHVTELPQKVSDVPSGRLPAGPYEGMTPEEAQILEQRQMEYIQRRKALADKFDAAWEIDDQNSDDRKSLMLSVFKSLPPEQLKSLREEALKTLPAEDVNYFFDDIENKGTAMTDEQLTAEGERILTSDEVLENLFIELEIEREELKEEYKELFGEESYNEVYGEE